MLTALTFIFKGTKPEVSGSPYRLYTHPYFKTAFEEGKKYTTALKGIFDDFPAKGAFKEIGLPKFELLLHEILESMPGLNKMDIPQRPMPVKILST